MTEEEIRYNKLFIKSLKEKKSALLCEEIRMPFEKKVGVSNV